VLKEVLELKDKLVQPEMLVLKVPKEPQVFKGLEDHKVILVF
jgi:hypothetical protein